MPSFMNLNVFLRFSTRKDLPVCKTRFIREKQGMPWNKQVAVHRTMDGILELEAVEIKSEGE